MPYLHQTTITLPFRIRSQSAPASPKAAHTSFSVDRSSTVHTIYTMQVLQLDGSSDSKPIIAPSPPPPRVTTPAQPTTARKRFANMFSSSKSKKADDETMKKEDIESEPQTPMRLISPRATESSTLR